MRKILFSKALMLGSSFLYAQSIDSITVKPYIEVLDSIFQHLDKERITTGVLYDRVFPWTGRSAFFYINP